MGDGFELDVALEPAFPGEDRLGRGDALGVGGEHRPVGDQDDPPERPYTKDELRAYLVYTRQKCQDTIATLLGERARYPYEFPWEKGQGRPISYLELLLYAMRHTQEHAAQLSLFLGAHGILDEELDWVMRAKADA